MSVRGGWRNRLRRVCDHTATIRGIDVVIAGPPCWQKTVLTRIISGGMALFLCFHCPDRPAVGACPRPHTHTCTCAHAHTAITTSCLKVLSFIMTNEFTEEKPQAGKKKKRLVINFPVCTHPKNNSSGPRVRGLSFGGFVQ